MRRLVLIVLCLTSTCATADVFRCSDSSGKTVYQSTPCLPSAKAKQLSIETDPSKQAEAEAKLKRVQDEYELRKSEQLVKDKQLKQEQDKELALEIARDQAIAEQQQAEAEKRQAIALEKQSQINRNPVLLQPVYQPAQQLPQQHIEHQDIRPHPSLPQQHHSPLND